MTTSWALLVLQKDLKLVVVIAQTHHVPHMFFFVRRLEIRMFSFNVVCQYSCDCSSCSYWQLLELSSDLAFVQLFIWWEFSTWRKKWKDAEWHLHDSCCELLMQALQSFFWKVHPGIYVLWYACAVIVTKPAMNGAHVRKYNQNVIETEEKQVKKKSTNHQFSGR